MLNQLLDKTSNFKNTDCKWLIVKHEARKSAQNEFFTFLEVSEMKEKAVNQ